MERGIMAIENEAVLCQFEQNTPVGRLPFRVEFINKFLLRVGRLVRLHMSWPAICLLYWRTFNFTQAFTITYVCKVPVYFDFLASKHGR